MLIKCKCGHTLSSDLYLTKHHDIEIIQEGIDGEDDYYEDKKYHMKPGSYMKASITSWHGTWGEDKVKVFTEKFICARREDLHGALIIPFESGMGCCDNQWISVKCNSCMTKIGHERYDCYESYPAVYLEPNQISFSNK